jgi:hypothetical protein
LISFSPGAPTGLAAAEAGVSPQSWIKAFLRRSVRLAALLLPAALMTAGDGTRAAVDVDVAQYRHWPAYAKTPVGEIQAQIWREHEDVIEGWDWSLPPSVGPKANSLLCISRRANRLPAIQFPANPVVSLWVFWSDLEPREDEYRFDRLLAQLKDIEKAGYGAIIRPMTAAHARPSYPDPSHTPKWRQKPCAPPYLVEKYGVTQIPEPPKKGWRIINLDPAHPAFHRRYIKFVRELGKSGIPGMDVVKGIIVGYKSPSWGDEGIGPRPETQGGEEPAHVKERLDAWADVCKGVEHKVCMGGTSEYGFSKGFGIRGGFVEMYLYRIPDPHLGQTIAPNGYLVVNEDAVGTQASRFLGDENEEYEESWTSRFGKLDSFVYRYFTASLRLLQMRRNYLLNNPFCVYPEMLPFISLEMGRTVEDTPDVWCALRESYLRKKRSHAPQPVRNFERWLHQRDSAGFETTPAIKIDHAIRMWMVHGNRQTGDGSYHDYVARRGRRIGFNVDERFLARAGRVAIKVTYFDQQAGSLTLVCRHAQRKVTLLGSGNVKTATFFIDTLGSGPGHDLIIEGTPEAVVAFVRVIKAGDH